MWKKEYRTPEEEKEICDSAKSFMSLLEREAYSNKKLPSSVCPFQSKKCNAFYFDPSPTFELIEGIKKLGFKHEEIELPPDKEVIFQTWRNG